MLKKCLLKKGMIITLTLLFSLIIIGNLAQAQTQRGNYRIGIQSSTLFKGTAGFSVIYDKSVDTSIQGIFSLGSRSQIFEGRFLYRFYQKKNWNAYGFGSAGIYNTFDSPGFIGGAGIGVEYDIKALDRSLPPVSVNADVGLIVLDDLSSFNNKIRIGFHYRF